MIQVATPLGFVSTTVAATALGFASIIVSATTAFIVPPGANLVVLVAQSSPVMFRDDGVSPTPTSGIMIATTVSPYEYMGDPRTFQFISASTTAVLSAAFYKVEGS